MTLLFRIAVVVVFEVVAIAALVCVAVWAEAGERPADADEQALEADRESPENVAFSFARVP